MIGQLALKKLCENWKADQDSMPALLILSGPRGSGKKTALEYIRHSVPNSGMYKAASNSVQEVREVIEKSYKLGGRVFYVFEECDNMRPQARNAMLKVMEEPPKGSRFILTVRNLSSLLPTIISRGFVYQMRNYQRGDVLNYINTLNKEEVEFLKNVPNPFLSTIGDIAEVLKMREGWLEMYEYARRVVNYIGEATCANALKIGTMVDVKGEDATKYPLDSFILMLERCFYMEFSRTRDNRYFAAMLRCATYWSELAIQTASRGNILDTLLIDLRCIMGDTDEHC